MRRTWPRYHTEYPYEWDVQEMEDQAIAALTEQCVEAGRCGAETKHEFTCFWVQDNVHSLVGVGMKRARSMIDGAWTERCEEYAREALR